jgi:inosine-5'-monophosphate dehydrogenase
MRLLGKALTFDDVLLVPAYSQVLPRDTSLRTHFSRNIVLNLPVVSAAMDTVTEARLAIAIAQEGGIGVIHKNLTAMQQAAEVARVKRYESGLLRDPVTIAPGARVRDVVELSRLHGVSGFPVVDNGRVVGIVTNRDLRFETRMDAPVREIMTPQDKLITVPEGTSLAVAKELMHRHKLERVLVVNDSFELRGLFTVKDITKQNTFPNAARDSHGKLRVAAAVGVGDGTEERVELLAKAGVDAIVVDTAHGHSQGVIDRVRWVKKNFPQVDVIGGNIATGAAALALAEAGADAVKVGIGPGSICTTRIVAGVGVPQVMAIDNVATALQGTGVHRDDGRHVRRHRRGAGRGHPVPGPQLQELPRHGLHRRDEGRLRRPLLPGSRREPERRQAGARRHRRPRPVQGLGRLDPVPDGRRPARLHGLLRLPDHRRHARQGRVRRDHLGGHPREPRARRPDHQGSAELPRRLSDPAVLK